MLRIEGEVFLEALSQARKRSPKDVVGELEREHPDWPIEPLLKAHTGVEVAVDGLFADLLALDRDLPDGSLAWRAQDGLIVVMPDPWDESAWARICWMIREPAQRMAGRKKWLEERRNPIGRVGGAVEGKRPIADGSAVSMVDSSIRSAWEQGASDIHYECGRAGLAIKFRLDGVLVAFRHAEEGCLAEEVISRLKVLAQLDITERRLPQDGRFRVQWRDTGIDLRVSIMPSVFGEDAVLRILDKTSLRRGQEHVTLASLGFAGPHLELLRVLTRQPHGMLLVTGPTGSGKTTTVYGALMEIYTGLEKIITIEDPVEYELPGILQIPVNEKKGLTFARGLRSILRHDPDKILVGEIRDPETAAIAVQSALTGHLVFTTVHANSIFDVVGRFKHFGIDMFGFVSALNGVVVQRLIRRVCTNCVSTRTPTERESRLFSARGIVARDTLLRVATGCDCCRGTGYRGRMIVSEVHSLDDRTRDLILRGAELSELRAHVHSSSGSDAARPLLDQALTAASAGLTTMEEIERVVGST